MNRILSIVLSLMEELLPFFRPSNRKGFLSLMLILGANSIPVTGVIFLRWNPFIILWIYWGESLIIGFFNLLKMLISGAIENNKFSRSGFVEASGLGAFFTVHYGMFMLVHGIFIFVFMLLSFSMNTANEIGEFDPLSVITPLFRNDFTTNYLLKSEFAAVAALFVSHLISFYIYFIRTGEYNYKKAGDYMMRPYKRIIIMHLTVIFGAIALFISGFKSAVFIIIWIGLKIFFDLRMHIREVKSSGFFTMEIKKS